MKALVFDNKLRFDNNFPDPVLTDGEVLIEVTFGGICSTDLEIVKGYMGFSGILGHEFVGKVVKGSRKLLGKRVVAEINCVCGKCDMCQSGLSSHCRNRTVVGINNHDGAFASYVVVPERNIHLLPDTVEDDRAVFIEPLAAAMQIVQQVRIERRSKVAVIGDGRLGLLAVQVLADSASPGNIVLVGKHEEKLTFAEKRGIRGILLEDMLIKQQWDIVVDCTGCASGFKIASGLVRPRGTLVLKSTFVPQADEPIDLSQLVINEVTLTGSRCGPFANAINTLAADKVEVNGLITSRFKLEDGVAAFEKARETGQIKVVLAM